MKIQKHFSIFILLILPLLFACQAIAPTQSTAPKPTVAQSPFPQSTPDIDATQSAQMQNDAQIKLSDNGKTFSYHITDRFSVFLDDTNYPVKNLTCTPDGIIGYVSNGSFRGPDRYPIMFEAAAEGQCVLKDGDFSVTISVAKP